jgi:hypothetical protein
VIFERNRPADTFGFGVVFSDATLGNLAAADPETHAEITSRFARWDDIEIQFGGEVLRSTGHGFCGIERKALLQILQARSARGPARELDLDFERLVGLAQSITLGLCGDASLALGFERGMLGFERSLLRHTCASSSESRAVIARSIVVVEPLTLAHHDPVIGSRKRRVIENRSCIREISGPELARGIVDGPDEQRRRSMNAMNAPTSRHRFQIDAGDQVLERALIDQKGSIASDHRLRDPKRPGIESLVDHAQPGAIKKQNLQRSTSPPEEYKQRTIACPATQSLCHYTRQPINPPSQVNRVHCDVHLHAMRDHRRPPRSSNSRTVASTARSVSDATVIRARASSNSITTAPCGASSRCVGGVRTTWANRTTGPTIASSRRIRDAQYRSELVVNPCCVLSAAAVSPLARQPATRLRHFVAVSDIARYSDPTNPIQARGLCTGYDGRVREDS